MTGIVVGMTDESSEVPEGEGPHVTARRRRVPLPVRVSLFFVVYVLSIGPMFWHWYEAQNMGGWPILRVFYAPLQLACYFPFVEKWLNRYISLWIA